MCLHRTSLAAPLWRPFYVAPTSVAPPSEHSCNVTAPVTTPLTHFDASGQAHMVDVSAKAETHRVARAGGSITMLPATLELIRSGQAKKGDVIGIARIAAIQGAKRTSDLIPLCHPLPITRVVVDFEIDESSHSLHCTAQVETLGRTGVEMEALTAVQVGLLTVYDMCKAADRGMVMGHIRVLEKSGGKSGRYKEPAPMPGFAPAPVPGPVATATPPTAPRPNVLVQGDRVARP